MPEKKSAKLTIQMTPDVRRRLELEADRQDRSMGYVAHELLDQHLPPLNEPAEAER